MESSSPYNWRRAGADKHNVDFVCIRTKIRSFRATDRRTNRQTDRQTGGQTCRQTHVDMCELRKGKVDIREIRMRTNENYNFK